MDTLGSSFPNAAPDAESAASVIETPSSAQLVSRTREFGAADPDVIVTSDELDASQAEAEIADPTREVEPPSEPQTPPAFLLQPRGLMETAGGSEAERFAEDGEPSGAEAARPAVFELAEMLAAGPPERPENLVAVVESLLFVAEEPPSVRQLAEATNVSKDAVEAALDEIESAATQRGLHIQRHGSTVRLVSAPESAQWVQRFLGLERPNKLSKAALETLAIIVYRQPVTRSDVEKIRGVGCDGPFHTLRLRELIESVGQTDAPGRPHLWGVTQYFLDHFGLKALDELPPLPGVSPTAQGKLSLADPPPPDLLGNAAPDDEEASIPLSASEALADIHSGAAPGEEAADDALGADEAQPLGEFAAAGGSGD